MEMWPRSNNTFEQSRKKKNEKKAAKPTGVNLIESDSVKEQMNDNYTSTLLETRNLVQNLDARANWFADVLLFGDWSEATKDSSRKQREMRDRMRFTFKIKWNNEQNLII